MNKSIAKADIQKLLSNSDDFSLGSEAEVEFQKIQYSTKGFFEVFVGVYSDDRLCAASSLFSLRKSSFPFRYFLADLNREKKPKLFSVFERKNKQ